MRTRNHPFVKSLERVDRQVARFYLIRHGSTCWNKEKRAQGHSQNPLDEEGVQQAVALADRLNEEKWDHIYSSDLLRARQTAEILADRLGVETIRYDVRLRERSGGRIEGTTVEERILKWGAKWSELDLGIETPEACMARGSACIREIAEVHRDGNILIVSHGALLRHTLKGLIPVLNTDELLANTSVTEVTWINGIWNCNFYNCTKHLTK